MNRVFFKRAVWELITDQPLGTAFAVCRLYKPEQDIKCGPVTLNCTKNNLQLMGNIDGVLNVPDFSQSPEWPVSLTLYDGTLNRLAEALADVYGEDFQLTSAVTYLFLRKVD